MIDIFIYLLKCAVNGDKPENIDISEDVQEDLLSFAKEHMLDALIASVLKECSCATDAIKEKCRHIIGEAVRRTIVFDNSRAQILSCFDDEDIWYIPLKGIILQDYYPAYGLRQMSDNDILIDKSRQKAVRRIMQNLGYQIENYNRDNHDVYTKPPFLNFEIHTSLFNTIFSENIYEYYNDMFKTDGKKTLDNEDMYVYLIAHAFKHHSGSGTGLRTLVDVCLLLKVKSSIFDWNYISEQCKILNISDFENQIRNLSLNLFSKDSVLTDDDRQNLKSYWTSGTYGFQQQRIKNVLHTYRDDGKSAVKFRYIFNRAFPAKSHWNTIYPITVKIPLLIPFLTVYRLISGLLQKSKKIVDELILLFKTDEE